MVPGVLGVFGVSKPALRGLRPLTAAGVAGEVNVVVGVSEAYGVKRGRDRREASLLRPMRMLINVSRG